jgi:hypothetical protein
VVAWYLNVRIGARGGAETRLGALVPRAATLKIFLPFKKRKGVQGEAAKKMKGNFWVLRIIGTKLK